MLNVLLVCKLLALIWSWLYFLQGLGCFNGHAWCITNCNAVWLIITSHISFSMPSNSMSGIPNNAGLSPGTTKNQHLAILCLWHNFTVYTPVAQHSKLLYVLTLSSCSLLHAVSLLLTLETVFWTVWMALDYHQLQNQFYMFYTPFFDW